MVAKPIEGLDEVLLDNSKLERMTRICTIASPPIRQALIAFLREDQNIFAWSHEDILGIDPLVVHKFYVSPSFPPIRQKKRVFMQERNKATTEEVYKLQEVEFIREVYYLDWLANVVMVKKSN